MAEHAMLRAGPTKSILPRAGGGVHAGEEGRAATGGRRRRTLGDAHGREGPAESRAGHGMSAVSVIIGFLVVILLMNLVSFRRVD